MGDIWGVTDAVGSLDSGDVDSLVHGHLQVVHFVAREIGARLPGHVDFEDLVSAGNAGLVQAARSFDASAGVPFKQWANRRIRGAILDELRSMDWASRGVRKEQKSLAEVEARLTAELGRFPQAAEVAREMGVSVQELAAKRGLGERRLLSLDVDESATQVQDPGQGPDEYVLLREQSELLRACVARLPQAQRRVLVGVFFEQLPMKELAAELGVTDSRVSQLKSEAVRAVRVMMHSSDTQRIPEQRTKSAPTKAPLKKQGFI